ncbi:RNA-binding S4 domain-containing protein [Tropicibacter oceani]|uniref:RNA-binding S4 domain-containing protein n=1 Tax=Tropicibacter oceani TaxID=3058420 RepID=A0ABY8QEU2_9RHOB|nr:RNA-binding S4 domain-containing protein [Tropicibacter oceani]WGW02307.1 RNA-binding S4 domain-containing protein [Tropicibacter oceani]
MAETPGKIRIDKWLWHARFFKTRTLAAKVVGAGHCRVNGLPVAKPAYGLAGGDVVTFPQNDDVRVIKVLAFGERRGPAPEAQALYEDLAPPEKQERTPHAPGFDGGGRPSKKDRRQFEKSRREALE